MALLGEFLLYVIKLKLQIKEFAEYKEVSVCTLHYYDEIGMMLPAYVDSSTGHR